MTSSDPRRFLRYLEAERKASMLYRSLAEVSDGERREALLELADIEDEHAAHWVAKLEEYGVAIPPAPAALREKRQRLTTPPPHSTRRESWADKGRGCACAPPPVRACAQQCGCCCQEREIERER